MIKARLLKSQRLEDGTVSYMLKGPGDDKAMRHAAIDLEGEEVEITKRHTGETAQVQHPAEAVLANVLYAAEEFVTVLRNALHMIKEPGSRGEALPTFKDDLTSAVTEGKDGGPGLSLTGGEDNE